jgi:hypothetical protein
MNRELTETIVDLAESEAAAIMSGRTSAPESAYVRYHNRLNAQDITDPDETRFYQATAHTVAEFKVTCRLKIGSRR